MKEVEVLVLGPYTYTVDWNWDDKSNWGYHDVKTSSISVHRELVQNNGLRRDVFFHELIHAAWSIGNLNAIDEKFKELEEPVTTILATQLSTFFRQNPELKEVLFD